MPISNQNVLTNAQYNSMEINSFIGGAALRDMR